MYLFTTYLLYQHRGIVAKEYKYKAVVICEDMNLTMFPFDEHECNLTMSAGKYFIIGLWHKYVLSIISFEEYYDEKDIDYTFIAHNGYTHVKRTFITHPYWNVEESEHMVETKIVNGIEVPSSYITIRLERQISSYVFHTFIPSFVLCVASTLSVFIHYDNMPARMSLVTSSCLSLITLYSGAK